MFQLRLLIAHILHAEPCSYQILTAHAPGDVAFRAEALKLEKHANLSHLLLLLSSKLVSISKTLSVIKDLGRRITFHSDDLSSSAFIPQRLP